MDRISLLPDCLLLEILSFLNAKSVVQTCVLSKRWKTLWTDISTLNFDFESAGIIAPNSKDSSAKSFICSFLSEHRNKFIKKLSFSSSAHTDEVGLIVDFLTCYSRHHTVQQLCLNTQNTVYNDWPVGLSTCSSLTVLKMKRTFADCWKTRHSRSLRILEVEYVWDQWFHHMFATEAKYTFRDCPNLESLVLVNYFYENVYVTAPKLENFELSSCSSNWELGFPQLELCAPSLKTVKFGNILPTVKSASEFQCIQEVVIEVDDDDFDGDTSAMQELKLSISQLLRVFHNARSFTLPFMANEVLLSVPSSLSEVSFPNLRYVKFKTEDTNQITSLPISSTFMNSLKCPNLEKLRIEVEPNQE